MKKVFLFLFLITMIQMTYSKSKMSELPKEKQTTLGLYVTAKEAYDLWKANPEKIKIIDVRTTEEYLYVGHGEMAWNIPLFLQVYEWDAEKQKLPMKPNADFLSSVQKIFALNDTLLITCRSGGRSAMAVNMLAAAGFKNVYNIIDGMEGDMVVDEESVFKRQRLKNGWKNSAIPYTYDINPSLLLLPRIR